MREKTKLRILDPIYDLAVGEQEGQSKQQVDLSAAKYHKKKNLIWLHINGKTTRHH